MKLAPQRFEVGGKALFLIDGLLDAAGIERVSERFSNLSFKRSESDRLDTLDARTFVAELHDEIVEKELLFKLIGLTVVSLFPGEDLRPYRSYVNCGVYGDDAYPHRDCRPDQNDITALYYVNRKWLQEWGGETVFFDDAGDARIAIAPRPGRTILFRGAIEHRTGIPTRNCREERLTLAYKFRAQSTADA